MLLLKSLFVLLHITTAAAWFGLALRLNAQARLALRLSGEAANAAADDLLRTTRQLRLFLVLTLVFALGAFFSGGGFGAYGPPFHSSLLLLIILLVLHVTLVQPSARGVQAALAATSDATAHQKKLSMATGIGHLLWLLILILMLWQQYFQVALH
ncbi:MAG: hypothetical protein KatS3mg044_0069 [Rhodothermaceae bacterium]|nr:MAG: hypothetical protein D6746_04210 [Bacteroidota bacterium]GIV61203.1 MAG: hypothetical protein KatS3mg044_0069 [Rhodothermaceae bacterium]